MLMCDCVNCTRAFHLGCVGMKAVPEGIWHCRYHGDTTSLKETNPREFLQWHLREAIRKVAGTPFALPFFLPVNKDGAFMATSPG